MTDLERAVLDVAALHEEGGPRHSFERYGLSYAEAGELAIVASRSLEEAGAWLSGCLIGLAFASSTTEGDED